MPVLVIHSAEDDRFPLVEHGQRLYDLAPSPKQLLRIRGKHGPETTSATVNPSVFPGIVTFLNTEAGFHLRTPLPSIAPTIAATIETRGIEAGLDQYRSLRGENPTRYEFQEPELNHLGYDLLARNKTPEAIAIFQLNAEQFPQSFDVYDSLGDAYVEAGKDAEAIESYRRSLDLFPGDETFIRLKVEKLRSKSHG
jgi:tetratricopeptide (TPR) repeat protein